MIIDIWSLMNKIISLLNWILGSYFKHYLFCVFQNSILFAVDWFDLFGINNLCVCVI